MIINLTTYKKNKRTYKFVLSKSELKEFHKKNTRSNKLGKAALLHGYETIKIKKWEKRHPKPTELQLKQDLFPETLLLGWEAGRDIALEHIRNMLIAKYYRITPKENKWHDVAIYKNTSSGKLYNYRNVDPSMHGYICQDDSMNIYTSLRNKFLNIKKSGNPIIKINLYDNLGNIRYTCAA